MEKLLLKIKQNIKDTAFYTGISHLEAPIEEAFKKVPRHNFVRRDDISQAEKDNALSIGYNQTISQPSIVAIMTQLLEPKSSDKVLEIGSGSGYQAAILSLLVKEVYSLEVIPELCKLAQDNLQKLNINNVKVLNKNGYDGLIGQAPFDKIIFTACAKALPVILLDQLKEGGIMVGPIKKDDYNQILVKITKKSKDNVLIKDILPVRFVPFVN